MPLTSKQMIKLLKKKGFIVISQNGSHVKLKQGGYFMNKLFYPASFHQAEEGGFWISFPDFPECLTQGENMEEAYEMAVDTIGLSIVDMIKENVELPKATLISDIDKTDDATIVIIEFDLDAYRRKHNSKAVKKTLSIPEWLNEEATALGINFSQVLQEALLQKIRKS